VGIEMRFGWRCDDIREPADGVAVELVDVDSGTRR